MPEGDLGQVAEQGEAMTHFRAATYNVYYKVKPADVVAHMERLKARGVSIVLLQEVNSTKVQVISRAGWKVIKTPKASNAIAWLPDVWGQVEKVKVRHVRLAQPYQRGPGDTVHTESPMIHLRHKPSGRTLWALSYHLPSRVQRKNPGAIRREVHRQAILKMDALAKSTITSLFGGDDNVHGRPAWLAKMKNLVEIVAPAWTHGGSRKIDDFRIKGLTVGPGEVLASKSDHRSHIREFTFKPLPKEKPSPEPKEPVMKSQNGWPVFRNSTSLEPLRWITGRVRPGDVHYLFDRLCERFHVEVEKIDPKSSWGYAYRPVRGQTSGFSNHSSATAIDLNSPRHPLGKRGTFTAAQHARIDTILHDLGGVIRWGGDYKNRADEMHFEVVGTPAQVAAVVKRLKAGKTPPTNKKDWFDMASKEELRAVVREELARQYRDEKGAPSIGNARIEDPDGGTTLTLARWLKKIYAASGGK